MIRAALNSHSASVRMVRKALGPLTLGLAIAIAAHGTASAAEEFAGTWAADLANCKTPQSRQDAPLILSAKGYDQHETHCKFSGLKPAGAGEWTAAAQCSVEGDTQSFDVRLTVSGQTLTLSEDGGGRDLLRCP